MASGAGSQNTSDARRKFPEMELPTAMELDDPDNEGKAARVEALHAALLAAISPHLQGEAPRLEAVHAALLEAISPHLQGEAPRVEAVHASLHGGGEGGG